MRKRDIKRAILFGLELIGKGYMHTVTFFFTVWLIAYWLFGGSFEATINFESGKTFWENLFN